MEIQNDLLRELASRLKPTGLNVVHIEPDDDTYPYLLVSNREQPLLRRRVEAEEEEDLWFYFYGKQAPCVDVLASAGELEKAALLLVHELS